MILLERNRIQDLRLGASITIDEMEQSEWRSTRIY